MCAGGATYVCEWYANTDERSGDIVDYMILRWFECFFILKVNINKAINFLKPPVASNILHKYCQNFWE